MISKHNIGYIRPDSFFRKNLSLLPLLLLLCSAPFAQCVIAQTLSNKLQFGADNEESSVSMAGDKESSVSFAGDKLKFVGHLQATTQNTEEATTLELGKPVQRELAGGQRHWYQIVLSAGQYVRVEISQRSIKIGGTLQRPDGLKIQLFMPVDEQKDLAFSEVADSAGIYRLAIFTMPKAPAGIYEIRIAELRQATDRDRALHEVQKLILEYRRFNSQGEFAEARPFLIRAVEIREKLLGPDNLVVANTLSLLALNYGKTGDYAAAEPLYLRALKIKEKVLGSDHPDFATELVGVGGFYREKGDPLKAEEYYRRALDILQRAQTEENPVAASALDSLAVVYYERGDYQAAERYSQRGRVIWEKLLGPDHFHLTPSFNFLGRVAYDSGDYAKATEMFQHALILSEKSLGQDHLSNTDYRNNLAMVYCTTGNYEKAEALYRQTLSIYERRGALDQPGAQEVLFGLARCYAAQGRSSEAVRLQSRVSEIEERHVSYTLAVGSEREKLAFLSNLSSRLSRNISFHTQVAPDDPAALNLAVTTILQRKGRGQDAMSASLSALHQHLSPEDQKVLEQLNGATSKLASLVLNGPREEKAEEYQKQIKALEEQREGLEAEISRRSAGFYERSQPVTPAAVQASIPQDAALIEFVVYRPFDPKAPDNQKAYGEPHYVVYVLRNKGEVRWKELGPTQSLDAQIDAWRRSLRDPGSKEVQKLAHVVDEHLMQPVRALVGGASQMLISPDGELNLIPFEALVDEQGRYLVDHYAFTYLTSGRDLLRLQVARESRSAPLIVANPSFGEPPMLQLAKAENSGKSAVNNRERRSVTSARDLSEVYFAPLGGTAKEAHSIQAMFPEASLLTGAQATESALKQTIAPRILHIATHGFFLQGTETAEVINAQLGARGISAKAKIENPLLRSGLALANANLRNGGNDNGILTALEASGLNLWGTKLVVLSACDTGLGEVRNGEGVYGLRRAFVLAGAESLVMSLWPVSDYSTRVLMTNYYKDLKHGLGRGAALRQVQLEMLKRNPQLHPFYWANFIELGEWGNLDGKR